MRHANAFRKLGRNTAERRQLFQNQITSLIRYERIITSLAKAKELRRVVEKTITKAKEDILNKLFGTLAERYRTRPGGYTRIYRIGNKKKDNSPLGMIELVDSPFEFKRAMDHFVKETQNTGIGDAALSEKAPKSAMVAKQVCMDRINLPNVNLNELRQQRKQHLESSIDAIFVRKMKPKFKEGWSVPTKGYSYLERILHGVRGM